MRSIFLSMSRRSLFGVQWALGVSMVCSQPLRPIPKALATRTAHPKLRSPSYHRLFSEKKRPLTLGHPVIYTILSVSLVISYEFLLSTSHDSQVGYGPCLASGKTQCFLLERKLPVLFLHDLPIAPGSLHSSLFVPSHLHLPVLPVLASSVFRYDATALFFATVRWHGVCAR